MIETGRVVALENDAVWVETQRQGSCGSCAARSGCGHGLLASAGSRPELVRARLRQGGPRDLALHDRVRIGIPERGFLSAAVLLYLFPLLCCVAAAMLASLLFKDAGSAPYADLVTAAAALLGLSCGFLWVRWRSGRADSAAVGLHPVVTARL